MPISSSRTLQEGVGVADQVRGGAEVAVEKVVGIVVKVGGGVEAKAEGKVEGVVAERVGVVEMVGVAVGKGGERSESLGRIAVTELRTSKTNSISRLSPVPQPLPLSSDSSSLLMSGRERDKERDLANILTV